MSKIKKPKRVVIKIGSRTLTGPDGRIDGSHMRDFVKETARLHERGLDIVVVSSGAIRTGAPMLNLDPAKISINQKQAAAAVGQGMLIARYSELFSAHGIVAAQALLTPDVINDRRKYLNARNTLRALLALRALPIVNENDTVAIEEIKFGDNDRLAAMTAILVDADLLINLSDVSGLCSDDPAVCEDARLLETVTEITEELFLKARGPRSGGSGGMATKLEAAQMCMDSGIRMVIADGSTPSVMSRVIDGEKIGTTFVPQPTPLSARKKWLIGCLPEGRIVVNDGAREMIQKKGKSLLPSGIVAVKRKFDRGACVQVCGESGMCFAKGLVSYSSEEIKKIMGRQSSDIIDILGQKISDDVIHRDDLTLF